MENKEYKFKKTDIFLLEEIINDKIIKNKFKTSIEQESSSIHFSNKEIESILDELTFLFASKGINKDYEPNALGLRIEKLIDIFNNYS